MTNKKSFVQYSLLFFAYLLLGLATAACSSPEETAAIQSLTDVLPTDTAVEPTVTQLPPPVIQETSPTATTELSPTATAEPSPTATIEPSPTATAEPSPTITPGPSPTPDFRAINVNTKVITLNESREQVPNEHARSELDVRGSGWGGGFHCDSNNSYQWTFYRGRNPYMIHEKGFMLTCLGSQDSGIMTTYDSLGQIIHQEEILPVEDPREEYRSISYDWATDIRVNPLGTYRIVIEYQDGQFEEEIEVYSPDEPRLIWVELSTAILTGFEPDEMVTFYVYEETDLGYASLLTSIADTADQEGSLIAQLEFTKPVAIIGVYGDISGPVVINTDSSIDNGDFDPIFWPISETGVEACRLQGSIAEKTIETKSDAELIHHLDHDPWGPARLDGEVTLVDAGTKVEIVNTVPEWNILGPDGEKTGWFWLVEFEEEFRYIWEGDISDC